MILNIVGDTHNVEGLKRILKKFDNVISLGDIAAVDPKEYFGNEKRYSTAWKFHLGKVKDMKTSDLEWFKKINVDGWISQLLNIKDSGKNLKVNMGNSDLAMIEAFIECKDTMEELETSGKFEIVKVPKLKRINQVQIIYLPFSRDEFEINEVLASIDSTKALYVVAHCPVYKKHKKEYYVHHFNAIKRISKIYKNEIHYLHGHIHADNSYFYKIKDLDNVTFITLKAEDTKLGFGFNHHVMSLNTENNNFFLTDLNSGEDIKLSELPEGYRELEDHWNNFKLKS